MEIKAFFKFIYRNLSVLILIPIVTVIITYFLVKSLPDAYVAQGQIATGIVDKSEEINLTDAPPLQQSEIEQKFSNLIQMMQMPRILSLVSYKLIIHDLTESPFKKPSTLIEGLNNDQRGRMIRLAMSKHRAVQTLSKANADEALLESILSSMKYDAGSIKGELGVSRVTQSDYITITFTSPNPDLSAFIVNTIAKEFINYYTSKIKATGEKTVNYLSKQLQKKQEDLNNKMGVLKYYKIENNVLNLPEQARIIFGQMIDVENRQADLQRQIIATSAAIRAIDGKFNQRDRKYFEATSSKLNSELTELREKAKILSDKWIDNEDVIYKRMLDSVQLLITHKINEGTDQSFFNPLSAKQDLIARKIGLQTELDLNVNSVNSLARLHDKLFAQFRRLVPFEASIQNYERDIEIASQEYLDILDRYNNTSMQTTFVAKLKITQEANQGTLVASKKMLLIILSGVISFVFCVLILFVLFYLDDSVLSAKQLANTTGLPVIGQLDFLNDSSLNIKNVWESKSDQFSNFKDQLRAIRLELNQELGGAKTLAVASFAANEGKSFLALNLAYAYALTSKRVLVIDGNFIHAGLTKSLKKENVDYIEDYLLTGNLSHDNNVGINILGNKGGDRSVFEIADEVKSEERFNHLKSLYDLIIIETSALVDTETSKEWILLSEKFIGIFEHKQYVTDAKKAQLSYIKSLDKKFVGWIFNKVPPNHISKKKPSKNT